MIGWNGKRIGVKIYSDKKRRMWESRSNLRIETWNMDAVETIDAENQANSRGENLKSDIDYSTYRQVIKTWKRLSYIKYSTVVFLFCKVAYSGKRKRRRRRKKRPVSNFLLWCNPDSLRPIISFNTDISCSHCISNSPISFAWFSKINEQCLSETQP